MARHALFDSKGVSLIEVLVALVILLVVSLAMTRIAMVSISTNLQNALRDEAVKIAEMRINQLRALPYTKNNPATPADLIAGVYPEADITRGFRGFTERYRVQRTVTDLGSDTKQIAILVKWDYRNQTYSHGATSIVRKQ